VDINIQNKKGKTALDLAKLGDYNKDIVEYLIKHGEK